MSTEYGVWSMEYGADRSKKKEKNQLFIHSFSHSIIQSFINSIIPLLNLGNLGTLNFRHFLFFFNTEFTEFTELHREKNLLNFKYSKL